MLTRGSLITVRIPKGALDRAGLAEGERVRVERHRELRDELLNRKSFETPLDPKMTSVRRGLLNVGDASDSDRAPHVICRTPIGIAWYRQENTQ